MNKFSNKHSKSEPEVGDLIRIETHTGQFVGNFIKYDNSGEIVVIKLDSGYDVALKKSEIKALSIIEQLGRTASEAKESSDKNGDISIITTGGTISSKIDYKTGGVSPTVPPSYYLKLAQGMQKYGSVGVREAMNIWSENMKPSDWVKIAKEAYDAIKSGSVGVIVTMGTDTMHYVSSALSFMLNPLSAPIVFTGAQRSPDRGSSDASSNLLLSAIVASRWSGGESVICMHANMNDDSNLILRGNKVRKMHTERRDTFRPINTKPLGRVYPDGSIEKLSDWRPRSKETKLDTKLDEKVKLIMSYPSLGGDIIDYYLDMGMHGLVLMGTGFGNLPLGDRTVRKALKRANDSGIPIAITSQAMYGSTNKFVYSPLRELSNLDNTIYLGDMLSETAYVKLMFVLGKTRKLEKVRELMTSSLSGEIKTRSEVDEFLV
jgi:glutamyl-tRNA(Gln) amidotransferase subunit D